MALNTYNGTIIISGGLLASDQSCCCAPCNTDGDCPEGECCVDGKCEPCAPCETDADCPEGEYCCDGVCQPEPCPCETDDDCPEGECCVDGQCEPCAGACCYCAQQGEFAWMGMPAVNFCSSDTEYAEEQQDQMEFDNARLAARIQEAEEQGWECLEAVYSEIISIGTCPAPEFGLEGTGEAYRRTTAFLDFSCCGVIDSDTPFSHFPLCIQGPERTCVDNVTAEDCAARCNGVHHPGQACAAEPCGCVSDGDCPEGGYCCDGQCQAEPGSGGVSITFGYGIFLSVLPCVEERRDIRAAAADAMEEALTNNGWHNVTRYAVTIRDETSSYPSEPPTYEVECQGCSGHGDETLPISDCYALPSHDGINASCCGTVDYDNPVSYDDKGQLVEVIWPRGVEWDAVIYPCVENPLP